MVKGKKHHTTHHEKAHDDIPHGTMTMEKETADVEVTPTTVRKYSDDRDHEGAGHPLCRICNHREDHHHTWKTEQVLEDVRDASGRISQRLRTIKHKVYDQGMPCQYACKCTEYH